MTRYSLDYSNQRPTRPERSRAATFRRAVQRRFRAAVRRNAGVVAGLLCAMAGVGLLRMKSENDVLRQRHDALQLRHDSLMAAKLHLDRQVIRKVATPTDSPRLSPALRQDALSNPILIKP